MKAINSKITQISLLTLLIIFLSSCMMTKTPVGEFTQQEGKEYTYAKGKQLWLFWGLIPVGRTSVATPPDGNCEVVTKFRLVDALISTLTVGIVTSYSIKVNAKRIE